jgi:hypothetical protein
MLYDETDCPCQCPCGQDLDAPLDDCPQCDEALADAVRARLNDGQPMPTLVRG